MDIQTDELTHEKKVFTWTIENFDAVRKSDSLICSKRRKVTVGDDIGLHTKWLCKLIVTKKVNTQGQGYSLIGLKLTLKDCDGVGNGMTTSIRIKLRKDKESDFKASCIPFIPRTRTHLNGSWTFHLCRKYAKVEDLPLVAGSLVLEIELTVYASRSPVPVAKLGQSNCYVVPDSFKLKFTEKLQSDLIKALNRPSSKSDAETKVISSDGKEFLVNRGILSARSTVFECMFQSEMSENRTGIVHLTGISSKTVEVLLRFMYTGTLLEGWWKNDVLVELVYAAGKYQLLDLLEFLDQVIGRLASGRTVGKLANLARKFSLKRAERELFETLKAYSCNMEDFLSYAKECM